MPEIKIEQYCVGMAGTNCYFIINKDTDEILIVDPGGQGEKLRNIIKRCSYKPAAILLTHGHFDHVLAVKELAAQYQIRVYAHEEEEETLTQPGLNLSGMAGKSENFYADVYVRDKQQLDLIGIRILVLHTPGHTDGGCCYYFQEQKILISGDTLFAGSVGRTDFPNGSSSRLIRSIREQLLVLPDDVAVYPGHMHTSTIGEERVSNPFL